DRDGNAAINIRAEGIRMIKVSQCGLGVSPSGATGEPVRAEGSAVSAVGGEVRPKLGRKSKFGHSPVITEAPSSAEGN
ncbi:MAG: hypothetical protein ACYT04_93255, partial [Nostoc sp.]